MNKNLLTSFVLFWLKVCAKIQLLKSKSLIVGITGSAGKSSAVLAAATVLSSRYQVKYTKKGNSETGIPFEILGIPVGTYNGFEWITVCIQAVWKLISNWQRYEILVVEMGIDSDKPPKNMEYLLSIIHPQIGVFLSLNAVHAANFSGSNPLKSIASEKGKLLTSLPDNGLAIYSVDYPQITELEKNIKAKSVTFSSEKHDATLKLTQYTVDLEGTRFEFLYKNKTYSLAFDHQLHIRSSFGTFAAALLIGESQGVDIQAGCDVLTKKFTLPPGRMSVIEGIHDSHLLDSSYNSSLGPVTSALEMLSMLDGRKIAVLGDMRELGSQTQHDHEVLAQKAADSADVVFLIGPSTEKHTLPELERLHFPTKKVFHFQTAYDAVEPLKNIVKKGDVILIKGSQNTIFLEIITKALMKNPKDAAKLLSRQTPYWEKQRQKLK